MPGYPASAFSSLTQTKGGPRLKAGVTEISMRIFTIGYEGATVEEFLAALQNAAVERLIDVRALPLSRRPGFSKTPLKAARGATPTSSAFTRGSWSCPKPSPRAR